MWCESCVQLNLIHRFSKGQHVSVSPPSFTSRSSVSQTAAPSSLASCVSQIPPPPLFIISSSSPLLSSPLLSSLSLSSLPPPVGNALFVLVACFFFFASVVPATNTPVLDKHVVLFVSFCLLSSHQSSPSVHYLFLSCRRRRLSLHPWQTVSQSFASPCLCCEREVTSSVHGEQVFQYFSPTCDINLFQSKEVVVGAWNMTYEGLLFCALYGFIQLLMTVWECRLCCKFIPAVCTPTQ